MYKIDVTITRRNGETIDKTYYRHAANVFEALKGVGVSVNRMMHGNYKELYIKNVEEGVTPPARGRVAQIGGSV